MTQQTLERFINHHFNPLLQKNVNSLNPFDSLDYLLKSLLRDLNTKRLEYNHQSEVNKDANATRISLVFHNVLNLVCNAQNIISAAEKLLRTSYEMLNNETIEQKSDDWRVNFLLGKTAFFERKIWFDNNHKAVCLDKDNLPETACYSTRLLLPGVLEKNDYPVEGKHIAQIIAEISNILALKG